MPFQASPVQKYQDPKWFNPMSSCTDVAKLLGRGQQMLSHPQFLWHLLPNLYRFQDNLLGKEHKNHNNVGVQNYNSVWTYIKCNCLLIVFDRKTVEKH